MTSLTEGFNYWIDKIESVKLNIPFSRYQIGFHSKTLKYYRIIAIGALIVFSLFWVYTGYEGTVIRLFPNEELQNLPQGVGIHFGTILCTIGSFLAVSYISERNKIKGLRNILLSFIISTGLINGLFEVQYTLMYDVIHHQAFWINAPFLYTTQGLFRLYPTYRNWYWLFAGILLVYLIKNHHKDLDWCWKIRLPPMKFVAIWQKDDAQGIIMEKYKYNKWQGLAVLLMACWLIWYVYPWDYVQVRAKAFPQYIYGFMANEQVPTWIPEENIITLIETGWKCVYVENTGVRIINEATKLVHFVFFTYLLIPRKKLTEKQIEIAKTINDVVRNA